MNDSGCQDSRRPLEASASRRPGHRFWKRDTHASPIVRGSQPCRGLNRAVILLLATAQSDGGKRRTSWRWDERRDGWKVAVPLVTERRSYDWPNDGAVRVTVLSCRGQAAVRHGQFATPIQHELIVFEELNDDVSPLVIAGGATHPDQQLAGVPLHCRHA